VSYPPSVRAMAEIAETLRDWRHRIVFIGGAVAPLLQVEPPLPRVRATDDVDAIAATVSYAEYGRLEQTLRDLGFRHVSELGPSDRQTHAHRWIAPNGTKFDLVPFGDHLGASGNKWDAVAVETATSVEIDGVELRHVNAVGFLVLKWAAYADRGADDPMRSQDVEDILALIASRSSILDEIRMASREIRDYPRMRASAMMEHPDFADTLDAHLSPAANRLEVTASVRQSLKLIATRDNA
jgi:predicted nucleotidyltransferase